MVDAATLRMVMQRLWQIEPGLVALVRDCVYVPLAARMQHGEVVQKPTSERSRQTQTATAWAVAFHPAGEQLAVGNEDRCVRVWSVRDSTCTVELHGHGKCTKQLTCNLHGHSAREPYSSHRCSCSIVRNRTLGNV